MITMGIQGHFMSGALIFSLLWIPTALSLSVSSCSDLGWINAVDYGSDLVCGESDLQLGDCSGLVTWNEADVYCRGKWGPPMFPERGRLCTLAELDADAAQDARCTYETEMIWSDYPCGTNSYFTSDRSTWQCTDLYGKLAYARCCSDVDLVTTRGSGGSCAGLRTFSKAKAFCESKGARLCTIQELVDEEPRGTGCNIDNKLLWSSDTCEGFRAMGSHGSHHKSVKHKGYYQGWGSIAAGTTTPCIEEHLTHAAFVRCCADVF